MTLSIYSTEEVNISNNWPSTSIKLFRLSTFRHFLRGRTFSGRPLRFCGFGGIDVEYEIREELLMGFVGINEDEVRSYSSLK